MVHAFLRVEHLHAADNCECNNEYFTQKQNEITDRVNSEHMERIPGQPRERQSARHEKRMAVYGCNR